MRTFITTVGTSLLTNRDDRPWADWRFGSAYPAAAQAVDWLTAADPRRASAEIHTWSRLGLLDGGTDQRVVLVHSQTEDGKYCAERLGEFADRRGLSATLRQVNELSYADAATFGRGLSRLVRLLAEEIRSGRARGEVAIAATGGFKAEIAIANLVGALLGSPVYYIYEQFQQLVVLEPLPVSLAPDWLREGAGRGLLHRLAIDDCLPRREVNAFLKAEPRLEMLLESADAAGDELICTNLLGEFAAQMIETPIVDWPAPCDTLPDDKVKLEGAAHHRPPGWQNFVDRLAASRMVRLIRYDGAAGIKQGIRPAPDNERDLLVVLTDGSATLGLRVGTTAETAAQRQLLLDHLRRKTGLGGRNVP